MPLRTATLIESLTAVGINNILTSEPLARHNTWKIGGPADILIEPASIEELAAVIACVREHHANCVVIGDGSNILFSDDGFNGVVIKIGRALSGCTIDGERIYVQAGIAVPRLARIAASAGLTGLEHISGIPGTLGGLVAMNGGSLGQWIGQAVETVRCIDPDGNIMELHPSECDFSYRHSLFLTNPWIITDVVLKLQLGESTQIIRRMLEIVRERRQKFPRRLPNCGSVFKRNLQMYEQFGPPGRVIEEVGLKGCRVGAAEVSHQHANFIINTGNATANDVLRLIALIRERVYKHTQLRLECEVRTITPTGQIHPAHRFL